MSPEKYILATTARGTLRIVDHKASQAETLIQAAWRKGVQRQRATILLRLMADYDAKPLAFNEWLVELKASRYISQAVGILIDELGCTDHEAKEALFYWLRRRCPTCQGRGFRLLHGRLTTTCKTCGGVGKDRVPQPLVKAISFLEGVSE